MFGGLSVVLDNRTFARFPTQKTGALLGYLSYYCGRAHPREVLIELLWPECLPAAGRNSLSVALSSLRHQLEPPEVQPGTIILADRACIRLNSEAVASDVADFERALDAAQRAPSFTERRHLLHRAVELYRGPLLLGYYENWILNEERRLAELHQQALSELIDLATKAGDLPRALDYAFRAVGADPLNENAHGELIRLYATTGQTNLALRQYRELARILKEEFDDIPSVATRELVREIESRVRDPVLPPGHRVANVPAPSTRFFGRENDIVRLEALLQETATSLVTITGAGGTGKTRLAMEAARRMEDLFHASMWFVPLADLRDPDLIVNAIYEAMKLHSAHNVEPFRQIVEALSVQPALLVLDNFEHLIEGAAVMQSLSEQCAALKCIVTSRVPLQVSGEREYALGSLPTPPGSGLAVRPDELASFASVQLFVDRAQAVRPDFEINPNNAVAIAELCNRLEGIPLSIELAAARAQVLTPGQMLQRLERQLDFLVSRKRGLPKRHRSIRATIEWSYQLLSPDLQRYFRQLTVFRGGWDLSAAEVVCEESLALDLLAQLRECSMIVTEESGGVMRFRFLDTVREYAAECLGPDDSPDRLRQRHAEYFLAFAEQRAAAMKTSGELDALAELECDLDNLRASLDWLMHGEQHRECSRLALAFHHVLRHRGLWSECRKVLQTASAAAEALHCEGRGDYATALRCLASISHDAGRLEEARSHTEASLEVLRDLDNRTGVAEALNLRGVILLDENQLDEAEHNFAEALRLLEPCEHGLRGVVLHNLALAAAHRGKSDEAQRLYEAALHHRRHAGDARGEAEDLSNLGVLAQQAGDLAGARRLYLESLELYRALRYPYGIGVMLNNLGELEEANGNAAAAAIQYLHSERLLRALQSADVSAPQTSLRRLAEQLGAQRMAEFRLAAEETSWEAAIAIHNPAWSRSGSI